MSSSFSAAWAAGDPQAVAFLPHRHLDIAARRAAVAAAAQRRVEPAVLDVLKRQTAARGAHPAQSASLAALADAGTVVVATGQQVGLFLGPLYTLYKAASAVVTARALAAETGARCVPVFWLQTEDHDRAEVDHTFIPADGPTRVALDDDSQPSERVPLFHQRLGPSIATALETMSAALSSHAHAAEHLALLSAAYQPDATFGEGFAAVLTALLGPEGLLVIDPRDPALSVAAAPVHARALDDAAGLASVLSQRSQALQDAGFAPQVHVRADAPLCFVQPTAAAGARYRVERDGDGHRLVGADVRYAPGALQALLSSSPERFSTSALLRPLLQDSWFPTAAYVGGPAEMAYFAQLAPLYERFQIPLPLCVPRARFLLVDDRCAGLLDKLALRCADVAAGPEALLAMLRKRAAAAGSDDGEAAEALSARLLAAVRPLLAEAAPKLTALDPSLDKAVARTDDAIVEAVQRLEKKIAAVQARRDAVVVERVERLCAALHPRGEPQERVYGLAYFAARVGQGALVRRIVEAVVPFDGALRELRLFASADGSAP